MTARRSSSLLKPALRIARDEDFETLYAIDQACFSPEVAYTREELHWYLNQRGAECIVAELLTGVSQKSPQPTIVGFVLIFGRALRGHIITIDVLETHRRKGLASALLQRGESAMAGRGIAEVWLETATNNESAIAFWTKHGYRNRGLLASYYPNKKDAYAMSKSLNTAPAPNEREKRA